MIKANVVAPLFLAHLPKSGIPLIENWPTEVNECNRDVSPIDSRSKTLLAESRRIEQNDDREKHALLAVCGMLRWCATAPSWGCIYASAKTDTLPCIRGYWLRLRRVPRRSYRTDSAKSIP